MLLRQSGEFIPRISGSIWGIGFPSLLISFPLQERVKGLAVHAGLARRGADIAAAAGQHGLRVGAFKAGQVLFPRILPGKRGKTG